jgi:hypothetical protein
MSKILYKNGGGFEAKHLLRIPKGTPKCDTILLRIINPTKNIPPETKIRDFHKSHDFLLTYDEAAAIIKVLADAMYDAMPRADRE